MYKSKPLYCVIKNNASLFRILSIYTKQNISKLPQNFSELQYTMSTVSLINNYSCPCYCKPHSFSSAGKMRFHIGSIFYVYERRLQVFVCVVKETEKVRVGEKGEGRETEHRDVNRERER